MLNFSFSTVLMALLTSSILVGLIAIIFLHNNTLVCAGYKLLGIFVGLAVIRLIVPLEFPFTMIDSCICLYFSPQFHMLHTERCSARRKTGCHHPWKLRFLWLCSHGLRYTGRPVYSSYSFHTSYLFSFLPCLVSTGGAVPVDAFSGVSAIRHSPPHHNPGCALHHILAPQCPNHIQ